MKMIDLNQQQINRSFEAPKIPQRVYKALEATDNMSKDMKLLVHEFGYTLVDMYINNGVKDAGRIRTLIHGTWMGAREPMQNAGVHINFSPVVRTLDAILLNAGAKIGAMTLLRILKISGLVIVPVHPSTTMVNASVEAVKTIGTVTKYQKHEWRLKCALEASARKMWPHLFV